MRSRLGRLGELRCGYTVVSFLSFLAQPPSCAQCVSRNMQMYIRQHIQAGYGNHDICIHSKFRKPYEGKVLSFALFSFNMSLSQAKSTSFIYLSRKSRVMHGEWIYTTLNLYHCLNLQHPVLKTNKIVVFLSFSRVFSTYEVLCHGACWGDCWE